MEKDFIIEKKEKDLHCKFNTSHIIHYEDSEYFKNRIIAEANGCVNVIIDMAGLKHASSQIFGTIICLVKITKENGGFVYCLNTEDTIKKLFEITKIQRLIKYSLDFEKGE